MMQAELICPHCGASLFRHHAPDNAALAEPIDNYPWSARTRHVFHRHEAYLEIDGKWQDVPAPIETFGDLCNMTENQLLREPNFGPHSLKEVKTVLAVRGLKLRKPANMYE